MPKRFFGTSLNRERNRHEGPRRRAAAVGTVGNDGPAVFVRLGSRHGQHDLGVHDLASGH